MKNLKMYQKKALTQYEDLRDTISVIEAMRLQDSRPGILWQTFRKKLHARGN